MGIEEWIGMNDPVANINNHPIAAVKIASSIFVVYHVRCVLVVAEKLLCKIMNGDRQGVPSY